MGVYVKRWEKLKADFDANQKTIVEGRKAIGKYTHFHPFPAGGPTAYYMTGEKDEYSAEAFIFKCRKGDYAMSFSASGISLKTLVEKIDGIYQLIGK